MSVQRNTEVAAHPATEALIAETVSRTGTLLLEGLLSSILASEALGLLRHFVVLQSADGAIRQEYAFLLNGIQQVRVRTPLGSTSLRRGVQPTPELNTLRPGTLLRFRRDD